MWVSCSPELPLRLKMFCPQIRSLAVLITKVLSSGTINTSCIAAILYESGQIIYRELGRQGLWIRKVARFDLAIRIPRLWILNQNNYTQKPNYGHRLNSPLEWWRSYERAASSLIHFSELVSQFFSDFQVDSSDRILSTWRSKKELKDTDLRL